MSQSPLLERPARTGTPAATAPAATPVDPRLARLAARSAQARQQRDPRSAAAPAPVQANPAPGRGGRPPAAGGPTTPARRGKRHAAKGSRTAALALSAVSSFGLAGYFHWTDTSSAATTTASTTVAASTAGASTATATALADGTYTGATDTNRWGPVQVQITVSGGKITAVTALQTPNGDNKSVSINQRAVPTLVSETLTAQSAKVASVSGATYTSTSYKASLQSAIDLARAAATSTATATAA